MMKTFLKIFFALFALSFLYAGNVYAAITSYDIKYPGSIARSGRMGLSTMTVVDQTLTPVSR